MSVIWTQNAIADIGRIAGHMAEDNPTAARRIVRELLRVGDSLIAFPHRGRAGRLAETRELTAARPYVIVYRVLQNGDVDILRVWHAAQDR